MSPCMRAWFAPRKRSTNTTIMLPGHRPFLIAAFSLSAIAMRAQYLSGDYGSVTNDSWANAATWKVYNGISWASSPLATTPPSPYARAFVLPGTTVTTANQEVGDLFIE